MTAIQNAPQHEQLVAAKERFTKAVHEGITKLMRQCGYSRERATAALLRELGRGDVPLENDEVSAPVKVFSQAEFSSFCVLNGVQGTIGVANAFCDPLVYISWLGKPLPCLASLVEAILTDARLFSTLSTRFYV